MTIYFVLFWSVTGQTPGMRAMRFASSGRTGRPPSFWRAFVRLIGLLLAIVPLFAGFLPVLFDSGGVGSRTTSPAPSWSTPTAPSPRGRDRRP